MDNTTKLKTYMTSKKIVINVVIVTVKVDMHIWEVVLD
jgi:hypothetical protein